MYNLGDGADVIYDRGTVRSSLYYGMMADGGDDTIRFGEGVVPEDVHFMLQGDDLVLTFAHDAADRITITDWDKRYGYSSETWTRIETVEFADGTILDADGMLSRLGTDGDDTIVATSAAVTLLDTGAGDDTITTGNYSDYVNGGLGNDTISSGAGNDTVKGGAGDDILNPGDGSDLVNQSGQTVQ